MWPGQMQKLKANTIADARKNINTVTTFENGHRSFDRVKRQN